MSTLWQDLRYALRWMGRSPGFTAAAVLTLALGMGVNTAIFSLVDAVLLRPLPYPRAERLVRVWAVNPREGQERANLNPLDFADYRRRARSFAALAGMSLRTFAVTGGPGEPEQARGARVSAGFFPALGARAALGRTFLPADEAPGAPPVAVLGRALWARRFDADPAVVGRTIELDDAPVTVVGVLPAGFRAPAVSAAGEAADPPQVWCPLQIREEMGRGGHWLVVLGRLAPGVTRQGAQAEMATLAAGLAAQHPETQRGWGIRLEGLREATAGEARAPLLLLALSVALVLLIACVNVANLLLARAAARRHEIGVRVALGASAPRLLRQLLTESLLLAAAGGAAGLGLARLALAALPRLAPNALPRQGEVGRHGLGGLDGRALAFTAGVALVAALLFGAVPAWRAAGAAGRLPRGRPGLARRLPAALVVAELALALVLAICAGLLLESFGRLLAVDPGLRPQGVLAVGLDLPAARYAKPYQAAAFFQALAERVAALPGVAGAAAVDVLPFGGGYSCNSFSVSPGEEKPAAEIPCAEYRTVVPGYFRTLGIALVRGRELAPADTAGAAPVAVINETLARGLWPGRDPVGRRLTLGFETTAAHTIVGVVRDVHHFGLAAPAAPEVYVSHLQHPASEMTLVVRARRDPAALLGGVRNAVRQLDARLPVGRVALMDDLIAASVAPPRLRAALLFLFAGLALCLAAVGVSGVVAAAVERRRQEIGVRMALGADRGAVVRLIVGETLVTTAAGLALGLAGAAAATRLLAGLLFGVGTAEPWVYAGSCALLALVAAVAGWIPAERASRMEPVAALAE